MHALYQANPGTTINALQYRFSTNMCTCNYVQALQAKSHAQAQFLKSSMKVNSLFKNFDDRQLDKLVEWMTLQVYTAGSYLTLQGNEALLFFILERGYLGMIRTKGHISEFKICKPGIIVGELSILCGCIWDSSLIAKTEVEVWCLDRTNFQVAMKNLAQSTRAEHIRLLKNVDKLKYLPEVYLKKMLDCLKENTFENRECIFSEGDTGDTLYIIKQGIVKLTRSQVVGQEENIEIHMSTLNRGDYFGEKALFNEDENQFYATAESEEVSMLMLSRKEVDSLFGSIANIFQVGQEVVPVQDEYFCRGNETPLSDMDRAQIYNLPLQVLQSVQIIAKGGYSYIRLVMFPGILHKSFVLKTLRKSVFTTAEKIQHLLAEKNILMSMRSSFIGKLYRTYQDELYVYFLMDAYLGGDVRHILMRCPFDYEKAKFCAASVVEALEYLHSRGIAHRDLKPDNLMLDCRGYIKLVDFNFAKYIVPGEKTYTICGTKEYCAPEIILCKGHDCSVDLWMLGILIYEVLSQRTPFSFYNSALSVFENILKGINEVKFHRLFSKRTQVLIRSLCTFNPCDRIGYKKDGFNEIRKDPWFRGFDWLGLRSHRLPSPFRVRVVSPIDTRRFANLPEFVIDEAHDRKIIASSHINWNGLF